jgi:hypothetical protein
MSNNTPHTFHIPVMGLGYTIDTPLKVAKFGISSVVSIMEDHLIEEMRKVHSKRVNYKYEPISSKDIDRRSKRIKAYLNFMNEVVNEQISTLKKEDFSPNSDLSKYFKMLPENTFEKSLYLKMLNTEDLKLKKELESELKTFIKAGSIDVNIMTKLDNQNYSDDGELLPAEYSDAKSVLKGYAESNLSSSIIFSAGMNPKLFTYCENFDDFYPDSNGVIKKKVVLKVSDFRSAVVQGKMFAKKGIWVSEFRIESGLNCGGHAFATHGFLLGPILEEFKEKRQELYVELFDTCVKALADSDRNTLQPNPSLKITAQGGIGTSEEDKFLMNYYNLDGTGWGSPFLLVPESTNVDEETLKALITARKEDFYISNSSPLGVPFNNFRGSSSEEQRLERIEKHKAGSPCYKKFLSFNTEFTEKPICTASRQFQKLKIEQVNNSELADLRKAYEVEKIMEKECLCEGLGASAILTNEGELSHKLDAVSICPGPNTYYFKGTYKLSEMVDHIYGRLNVLNKISRPHIFINEAQLYIDYLKKELDAQLDVMSEKQQQYYQVFKENLEKGLNYYTGLLSSLKLSSKKALDNTLEQIEDLKNKLQAIQVRGLNIV